MLFPNQVQPPAEAQSPQTIGEYYESIMAIPGAPWIIWTSVLVSLVLIAVYVVGLFRNLAIGEGDADENDHLSEFRKLRDQGLIDDEEYKRLTSVVPLPLPDATAAGSAPSSVNPVAIAGGGAIAASSSEPAKRKLTLAEAEALKRQREQDAGSKDNRAGERANRPDQSDDTTDPTNP